MSSREIDPKVLALVADGAIRFSGKAKAKLFELGLLEADLQHSILNGVLLKKERDAAGESSWTYTIGGPAISGKKVYSCGKICKEDGDHIYFFITIEWLD